MNTLEEAVKIARNNGEKEIFIIGGAEIYNLGFSLADKLYITEINTTLDGDTYFPNFDKKEWKEISKVHHTKDERHIFDFDFVVYQK